MCRGLAAGYDTEKHVMICTGESSHTYALGDREDACVKLEIIVNDSLEPGYEVLLDHGYGEAERRRFPKYILKTIEPSSFFRRIINRWLAENETQVLRWLLRCQSHAKISGDTDCSRQEIKGNTANYYQTIGGNSYNSYQTVGGEFYIGFLNLKKYPNTTKLIKKAGNSWDLTLVELISCCIESPERAKTIIGKELKCQK